MARHKIVRGGRCCYRVCVGQFLICRINLGDYFRSSFLFSNVIYLNKLLIKYEPESIEIQESESHNNLRKVKGAITMQSYFSTFS